METFLAEVSSSAGTAPEWKRFQDGVIPVYGKNNLMEHLQNGNMSGKDRQAVPEAIP